MRILNELEAFLDVASEDGQDKTRWKGEIKQVIENGIGKHTLLEPLPN